VAAVTHPEKEIDAVRTRKFGAVLLGGALVAGMAACGSDNSGSSSATTSAAGAATTQAGGAAFTPIKAGTLTVVTSLPGPGFWNGSESDPSKLTGGYEYDIAHAMQQKLGMANVEVRNENFDAIVAGQAGQFDIALSQVTITDERKKVVDFTEPYFEADQGVLVNAGTKVPDLAAAKKLVWGVQTGTTGADYVSDTLKPDKAAQPFVQLADGFTALQAKQVDAFMMDVPIVLSEAGTSGGKLEVAAQFKTGEEYGGILPKGSTNKAAFDAILKGLKDDGSLAKFATANLGGDPNKVPVISAG
jgi:polar amino acid transport system substrate-binding protein